MIGESGVEQMGYLHVSLCLGPSFFFILAELIGQMVAKRKGQQVRLCIWEGCLKWDPAEVGVGGIGWAAQWKVIKDRT